MNRYPVWKYAILVVALLVGCSTPLPNFLVRRLPCRCRRQGDRQGRWGGAAACGRALKAAALTPDFVSLDGNSVRARFDTPDNQLKARTRSRRH